MQEHGKTDNEPDGFTCFQSFEDLLTWSPKACMPAQKARQHLVQRQAYRHTNDKKTAKVLLIHDYATGYHDYEGRKPQVVTKPPYTCSYLQFVDTFVYFTHNLVSVPPPTWIDCLHRNGVKVLGTFLVEPQTHGIDWILRRETIRNSDGEYVKVFPVAEQLRELASTIGFDGWLINIEKEFLAEVWNLEIYLQFLRQLKADHGMIIYYDALTVSNTKSPQNALTKLNSPLLQEAGHILLNYRWDPSKVQSSLALAKSLGLDPEQLFFGIDMWAQNRPRSFWHPRITWPSSNGGGTNTGLAVQKLAEFGASAGLFAPAWTHQHFQSEEARSAAEKSVWLGDHLLPDASCDCQPGWFDPKDPHRTAEYEGNGIVRSAREYPAGNGTSFHTNFHPGFASDFQGRYITTLGRQSILPIPVSRSASNSVIWRINFAKPSLILELLPSRTHEQSHDDGTHSILLFHLNIPLAGPRIHVRCRYGRLSEISSPSITFEATNDQGRKSCLSITLTGVRGQENNFDDILTFEPGPTGEAEHASLVAVYVGTSDSSERQAITPILELSELEVKATTG